jgi:hypothetical protein
MPEIGDGLLPRRDGKTLRLRAVSKSGQLGEDKPHPMTLLPAAAQLVEDTRIDRQLSIEETLEVEGIDHGADFATWLTSRPKSKPLTLENFDVRGWQIKPCRAID